MIEPLADRPTSATLGADKGYDARVFVNELRAMNVRKRAFLVGNISVRHAAEARPRASPGCGTAARGPMRLLGRPLRNAQPRGDATGLNSGSPAPRGSTYG